MGRGSFDQSSNISLSPINNIRVDAIFKKDAQKREENLMRKESFLCDTAKPNVRLLKKI